MIKYVLPSVLIFLTLSFNEVSLSLYGDNKAGFTDTSLYQNNFKIQLQNDDKFDFSISNEGYFSPSGHSISTSDLKLFNLNESSTGENYSLNVPVKACTYSSVSTSKDLTELISYAIAQFGSSNFFVSGYLYESFWREFIAHRSERVTYYNEENPNSYDYPKDENGNSLDIRMLNIFHELMSKKGARDLIYESVINNYRDNATRLSKVQKQLILEQFDPLIKFCNEYTKKRSIYMMNRSSVTEKPGQYQSDAVYGYSNQKEGFLFRRIEFDKVPPTELAAFLSRLKNEVSQSVTNSSKLGDMQCDINDGSVIVTSHYDTVYGIVFQLSSRKTNNKLVVPYSSFELTVISSGKESFYRIKNKHGGDFFSVDQDLRKL